MSDGLDWLPSGLVQGIRPIPPRISLLFSEAFNNLRAALDNVIWQLVEAMQGPVTGSAAFHGNLPICDDEAGFDSCAAEAGPD